MTLQELKEKIKSGEITDMNLIADIIGGNADNGISYWDYDSLPGGSAIEKSELLFNELKPTN